MSRDTYGKIPKYLAKRKTEGADGEPSEDALLVKSTIPKKTAPAGRSSKVIDKVKPRNTTTTARATPWPELDEVKNGQKRKSVKMESRLERIDSERHVRIASKLGDEPVQRRSSSRIPRRNSSEMLPFVKNRRKSSVHQTQIRRGSRIPGSFYQNRFLYHNCNFKYQKQTYTMSRNKQNKAGHQSDANQSDVNQSDVKQFTGELSRRSTHHR